MNGQLQEPVEEKIVQWGNVVPDLPPYQCRWQIAVSVRAHFLQRPESPDQTSPDHQIYPYLLHLQIKDQHQYLVGEGHAESLPE